MQRRPFRKGKDLFLLYVSIMLIITYLQQEFIFLPEIQSIDIIGEEAKLRWIEKFQKMRWMAFILPPLILLLRLSLVSLCFLIGSFFFPEMVGIKFKDWWNLAIYAQCVLITYSVCLCAINIYCGPSQAYGVTKYFSFLFLISPSTDQWIKIPLAALNIFEIGYWFITSFLISKFIGQKFWRSLHFVMSTYGVGYLLYIVLLMFLVLYLGTNV